MSNIKKIEEKIKIFDLIEVNLTKSDYIWEKISKYLNGKSDSEDYEILVQKFYNVIQTLPKIENWMPSPEIHELSEVTKLLIENDEIGDWEFTIDMNKKLFQPEQEIRQYKYLVRKKRHEIIREYIKQYLIEIEKEIERILIDYKDAKNNSTIKDDDIVTIVRNSNHIEFLIGKAKYPKRWSDFKRHIHFHLKQDFEDIKKNDLPDIWGSLNEIIYHKEEPLHIGIESLDDIEGEEIPSKLVIKSLKWNNLNDDSFERIIYNLISSTSNYENPKWLTKTRAADKGRDLSVDKIVHDDLVDTQRFKVIIQCKHWLSKSLNVEDIIVSKEKIKNLEPPKIEIFILV